MKKLLDMRIVSNEKPANGYALLKLTPADGSLLPEMEPGQFVNVEVADSKQTFLRRPISINFVDRDRNELWLLVKEAGEGTRHLCAAEPGKILNILLPLGCGYTMPGEAETSPLLIGGGVGCAPLLYLGIELKKAGHKPRFLIGARSDRDFMLLDLFREIGEIYLTTEDGSAGTKGFVTDHEVLAAPKDRLYVCGPMPMMKAVAARAKASGAPCEVSLENTMACGLGACLCCVEDTKYGHACVCTAGPVFNINELKW